ncbi:hypothetical protein C0J52_10547 [Blattella germanica]|nr:hypothetical protein C0J52_10547 [Blattella germanica]
MTEKRLFLSEAYRCQEAWEKRLTSPILQKIQLTEFYQEVDGKFNSTGKANALDIDLFANVVQDESHLDELEDLLHKLRLSPNTSDTLPSTPHSVIRTYISLGKYDDLLRVLNDRLNYGIFPDDYCSALLLDTFLKEKNYTAAAKVCVLHMLQEDWSNPVISHLALYACYMHLKNPGPWELEQEPEEEVKDDGEEVDMFKDTLNELKNDDPSEKDMKNKITKLVNELVSTGLIADGDLQEIILNKVKPVVSSMETELIEKQCKAYSEWETLRKNILQQQLDELNRQQRLAKVKEEKENLQKREEVIFFFDNEEKWELEIEKKEAEINKIRKVDKKKKINPKDEIYIPPEV